MQRTVPDTDLPTSALLPFVILTFGIAWGVFALFAFASDTVEALFGPPSGHHPLFILAVYAPAISALLLVGRRAGAHGVRAFLSRVLLWRAPAIWYVILLVGLPALYYAGAMVKGAPLVVPFDGFGQFLGLLAFMAILGPVEEFGWRGVALPLLQRRMVPLVAALVLGTIWGLWHLPAFLLSGTPQSNWQLLPFVAGSIAISVIVTPLFNASRGSILLPMLFHWQLNNPAWPDAQPYDTIFFIAAAVAVTWGYRSSMLTGKNAVTEVIPAGRVFGKGQAAEGL